MNECLICVQRTQRQIKYYLNFNPLLYSGIPHLGSKTHIGFVDVIKDCIFIQNWFWFVC